MLLVVAMALRQRCQAQATRPGSPSLPTRGLPPLCTFLGHCPRSMSCGPGPVFLNSLQPIAIGRSLTQQKVCGAKQKVMQRWMPSRAQTEATGRNAQPCEPWPSRSPPCPSTAVAALGRSRHPAASGFSAERGAVRRVPQLDVTARRKRRHKWSTATSCPKAVPRSLCCACMRCAGMSIATAPLARPGARSHDRGKHLLEQRAQQERRHGFAVLTDWDLF